MTTAQDTIEPSVAAAIRDRLARVTQQAEATVLWAVESGSRAWGFPSPDSDYDCRFLFVRPLSHYLTPWPRRDTIELPIEDKLDLAGWDLGKAITLLLKGNAVLLEWLSSPIVYAGDHTLRDRLLGLAASHGNRTATAHHYLNLGERQRHLHLAAHEPVRIKKIFYTLRPAAALRWLRKHDLGVPPMRLQRLLGESEAPAAIQTLAAELVAQKADALEADVVALPPELARWMDEEFEAARAALPERWNGNADAARKAAETLFQSVVLHHHHGSASIGAGTLTTPSNTSALV